MGQALSVWDAQPKTPRSYQWNFGIQRQLPSDILVEAAYVANRGLHLTHNFAGDTLNPQYLSMGTALQARLPTRFNPMSRWERFPAHGDQQQLLLALSAVHRDHRRKRRPGAGSNYQSTQFKLNKQTTHGVSMLAMYTISKWMSNVTSRTLRSAPRTIPRFRIGMIWPGKNLSQKTTFLKSLILNVVADLPFGRAARFLSSGQRASGTSSLAAGARREFSLSKEAFRFRFSAPMTDGGTPSQCGLRSQPGALFFAADFRKGCGVVQHCGILAAGLHSPSEMSLGPSERSAAPGCITWTSRLIRKLDLWSGCTCSSAPTHST